MDRRNFFRKAFKDSSKAVVNHVAKKAQQAAVNWIRPPFAIDELEFLLACTRCDACTEACPHDVIFKLPSRLGAKVTGTPALDLLNKGCHLCADWPCVTACDPKALCLPEIVKQSDTDTASLEENQPVPPPRLAAAIIDTKSCLPYNGPECGACASSCPVPGALLWDQCKPVIDDNYCVGCGLCRESCINNPSSIFIESRYKQPDSSAYEAIPSTL